MPLEIAVIGSGEAYSIVAVHAQITGELTSVNFKEGDDVSEGQVLFTLDRRPLEAALQQAQANLAARRRRRRPTPRRRRSATRIWPTAASRRTSSSRRADDERGRAQRHGRCRPGRGRKRAGPAAVRDDRGADLRTHRRADGARGQPRARQRHDAARRHQSDRADLRHRSRFPKRSCPDLKRYMAQGHARASRRSRRTTPRARRTAAASRSSTTPSIRRRARSRSRRRSRTTIAGSVAGTVRQRRGRRSRPIRTPIVVPTAAVQTGQQGTVRVRRQGRQDRRAAVRWSSSARAGSKRSSRAA